MFTIFIEEFIMDLVGKLNATDDDEASLYDADDSDDNADSTSQVGGCDASSSVDSEPRR